MVSDVDSLTVKLQSVKVGEDDIIVCPITRRKFVDLDSYKKFVNKDGFKKLLKD